MCFDDHRLARAAAADEHGDLARKDLQVHPAQHHIAAKALAHTHQLDHRLLVLRIHRRRSASARAHFEVRDLVILVRR